jgi:hypothetical protein
MLECWRTLRERMLDERFVVHRYKSTSYAGSAVAVALGGLSLYDYFVHGRFRWDLFGLLCLMVVVKLGCMTWFRLRD